MLSNVTAGRPYGWPSGCRSVGGLRTCRHGTRSRPERAAGSRCPSAALKSDRHCTRIRRRWMSLAAPITIIDSAAIAQSGYQTAGDLLALPGVAGSATSPALNNGGGFGESA